MSDIFKWHANNIYLKFSSAIVCSTVDSGPDQRKHQSYASLAFVRGIHRGPVNSPHKSPVTRKMFPFDDVIMDSCDSIVIVKLAWWLLLAWCLFDNVARSETCPLVWFVFVGTGVILKMYGPSQRMTALRRIFFHLMTSSYVALSWYRTDVFFDVNLNNRHYFNVENNKKWKTISGFPTWSLGHQCMSMIIRVTSHGSSDVSKLPRTRLAYLTTCST